MNETEQKIVAWLRKQIVERELSPMTRHELIILTYELESGEHRESDDA